MYDSLYINFKNGKNYSEKNQDGLTFEEENEEEVEGGLGGVLVIIHFLVSTSYIGLFLCESSSSCALTTWTVFQMYISIKSSFTSR